MQMFMITDVTDALRRFTHALANIPSESDHPYEVNPDFPLLCKICDGIHPEITCRCGRGIAAHVSDILPDLQQLEGTPLARFGVSLVINFTPEGIPEAPQQAGYPAVSVIGVVTEGMFGKPTIWIKEDMPVSEDHDTVLRRLAVLYDAHNGFDEKHVLIQVSELPSPEATDADLIALMLSHVRSSAPSDTISLTPGLVYLLAVLHTAYTQSSEPHNSEHPTGH